MNREIPEAFRGFTGIRILHHDLRVIQCRDHPYNDDDLIEELTGKFKKLMCFCALFHVAVDRVKGGLF